MYQILEEIPLFDGVKKSILKTISEDFNIIKYKRNDHIMCEGDRNNYFYIIAKGSVRVYRNNTSKKNVILALLHEGDFFGEMSILDDSAVSANVTALQKTELLCMHKRKFKKNASRSSDLLRAFILPYVSQDPFL